MDEQQEKDTAPLSVFISYAHEDEMLCNELKKHLSLLQNQGVITTWHDREVAAGADWSQEIDDHLNMASLILLLVSSDFLASPYRYGVEMERAMKRGEAGEACVIPILLRPVDWQSAPFARFQALPKNGRPIKQWQDSDEAFTEVAQEIRRLAEVLRRRVVIVATRDDQDLVMRLKHDLEVRQITTWTWENDGPSSQETLYQALQDARAVFLIASPHTAYSYEANKQLETIRLAGHQVTTVWMEGEDLEQCLPKRWQLDEVVDARQKSYAQALEHLLMRLQQRASVILERGTVTQMPPLPGNPRNPYKGLQAFIIGDASDFFGRDRLIGTMTLRLASTLKEDARANEEARLLAVVGPSGSGKSSVVMAGLLSALQQGALPGSKQWVNLGRLLPGPYPLEALAAALARPLGRMVPEVLRELEGDSLRVLHQLVSGIVSPNRTKAVLLIDQFEELFTLTRSQEERSRFIAQVRTAITEPRGPLIVILTLRADFYGHLMDDPPLYQLIERCKVDVFPMDLEELRSAIEGPASLRDVHLSFESGLVEELLVATQGQSAILPLLQVTLDQLVRRRQGHQLTLSAYREMGGIQGALTRHAEQTYQHFSEEQQQQARALFLNLVDPETAEQEPTRRRVALSKLERFNTVIEALTDARLLTAMTVADIPTVEVSHEALIRAWERLEDWLREAYDDHLLMKNIREDALKWKQHSNSVDWLYRGEQLMSALACRERIPLGLGEDEEAFLQASVREREKEQALIEESRKQAKLQQRRTVLIGLGLVGLVGTITFTTGYFLFQITEPPPSLVFPFTYRGHKAQVNSVAWSPDGRRLASAGKDRTVQVWDATTGKTLFAYRGHSGTVSSVAWSPDGRHLASASSDSTVQVWDATSGKTLLTYRGHKAPVESVAWSPNGRRLASSSVDAFIQAKSTVQVWDVTTGKTLLIYGDHNYWVNSVAWSPNGQLLASAGADSTVQVWDATSGKTLLTYRDHTDQVIDVAWSPDGRRLASASIDPGVQVWDANTGETLLTYEGHSYWVESVAWSPDGQLLASAGSDKTVQVWETNTGETLFTYQGHHGLVRSVAWSPKRRRLASASDDTTVQLWDPNVPFGVIALTYRGHSDSVVSMAWSPDGQHLASASLDTTVQIWDAHTGKTLLTYQGNVNIQCVAWSPDGKRLASMSADTSVQVWDVTTGKTLLTYLYHNGIATSGMGYSVAWSPDGKRIASVNYDRTVQGLGYDSVQVWDAHTGKTLFTYQDNFKDSMQSVAWSPDGRRLASGSFNLSSMAVANTVNPVQVWDAATGKPLLTYRGHRYAVSSVAWSPDGRRLASASGDFTVQVWDAATGRTFLTYQGHTAQVNGVAWSPDGRRLASASSDKTVQVWDANTGKTLFTYRGHSNTVNSVAWSPDGKRIASASDDKTVQVWLWLEP